MCRISTIQQLQHLTLIIYNINPEAPFEADRTVYDPLIMVTT